MDILFLFLIMVFFAATVALAYGCERLRRPS